MAVRLHLARTYQTHLVRAQLELYMYARKGYLSIQ